MVDFGGPKHLRNRQGLREMGGTIFYGSVVVTGIALAIGLPTLLVANVGGVVCTSALLGWRGTRGLCRTGFTMIMAGALVTEGILNEVLDGTPLTTLGTLGATFSLGTLVYYFGNGRDTRAICDPSMANCDPSKGGDGV